MRNCIARLWELALRTYFLPPEGRRNRRLERASNRRRRARRRAVWLALYGVDVGPRVIHGVVVR